MKGEVLLHIIMNYEAQIKGSEIVSIKFLYLDWLRLVLWVLGMVVQIQTSLESTPGFPAWWIGYRGIPKVLPISGTQNVILFQLLMMTVLIPLRRKMKNILCASNFSNNRYWWRQWWHCGGIVVVRKIAHLYHAITTQSSSWPHSKWFRDDFKVKF